MTFEEIQREAFRRLGRTKAEIDAAIEYANANSGWPGIIRQEAHLLPGMTYEMLIQEMVDATLRLSKMTPKQRAEFKQALDDAQAAQNIKN